MRWLYIPLVLITVLLATSCREIELPGSDEIEQAFMAEEAGVMLSEPEPAFVPVHDAAGLSGTREFCDGCHTGPGYDSRTILAWAHRDNCIADVSCRECHGEALHSMDVSGTKGMCFNCHITHGLAHGCSTCHIEGYAGLHAIHDPGFMDHHGEDSLAGGIDCFTCHGSTKWCLSCHGLPMPHPPGIIEEHPLLVRGRPSLCASCHGGQSCERCHRERAANARAD